MRCGLSTKPFSKHTLNGVIHLAAESHVDRSISHPMDFVQTNVLGTVNLLNAAKKAWKKDSSDNRFYHVSTDEVYGSLGPNDLFTETTAYNPKALIQPPKLPPTILYGPTTIPITSP